MESAVKIVYKQYLEQTKHKPAYSFRRSLYLFNKRSLDLFLAVFGLIFAAPVLIISAMAIRRESAGGVFFLQERVGKDGEAFMLFKLRTMIKDAELDGPQLAQQNDSRVTRIGRFLRRTRIDEIPQLINVIKGDMSMVGPRPERPFFTIQFNGEIPGFVERLRVKPGVTGLAQVAGAYNLRPARKLRLDKIYMQNQSIMFDIIILTRTVAVVLTGRGAR